MNSQGMLFALLRAAVSESHCDSISKESCTPEMISSVYLLAKKHDLAHLVGHVLGNLKLEESEHLGKLKNTAVCSVCRYVQQNYEYQRICKTLEQAKIPFIPLKGTVMRKYYPEPWMRTSCDIDILVKEEHLEQAQSAIQGSLHYVSQGKGDHDVSLLAPTGVLLELHYDTVQQRYADDKRRNILKQVWELSFPKEKGQYEYLMPDALFYFYHIAHMAKHFENGGCGIRPVLDIWILNHRIEGNREKRKALLSEGGLITFAQTMEELSEVWFSDAISKPLTAQVSDYILFGGVYGNQENRAAYGQAKSGGKLKYLITRRVFMPYDYLKAEYPVLQKHRWLTPLYQVVRWVRMLRSGRTGIHLREILANVATNEDTRQHTKEILKQLGL